VKKTLIVAAFAAVLVFAFAATAFAYGPIYSGGYNAAAPGYLSWSYVEAQTGTLDGSPHGNYTTTSSKCAVCHAVHRADPAGVVLTAWGGVGSATPAFSATMAPYESCFFCHGNGATFTDKTVEFYVTTTGVLSPHTTCGRCHTASPHGADGSDYPILASKLINDHADYQLDYDLVDGAGAPRNGLDPAMFDLSDGALYDQGMTLATGYLCVGCHGAAGNQHVFSVNERGATPAIHYGTLNPAGHAFESAVTGHQVWIGASSDWSNPGTWYSGGGAHDYYLAIYKYNIGGVERWFKVATATTFQEVDPADGTTAIGAPGTAAALGIEGWDSTIAFNSAYGCGACHDATRTNGALAFPHGYVNSIGAPAPKWANRTDTNGAIWDGTTLEASFLWMTVASDAGGADTALMLPSANNNIAANKDGACLKCHVNDGGTAGVGITY
jgi:cytochrome c553